MRKLWKKLCSFINTLFSIIQGIHYYYFKSAFTENLHSSREPICQMCKSYDRLGTTCMVPGTKPCCGECGCSLELKLRSPTASCPLGKWDAIFSEEEFDRIEQKRNSRDLTKAELL